MTSKRKSASSRRNARCSRGAKTPEGKVAASMKGLKRGLRAQSVALPTENRDEFDQIHASLQKSLPAPKPVEQALVDHAVIAQWKLVRAEVFEGECYAAQPDPIV